MKTYRTPADLQSIVDNAIQEGVSLEYKASDVIANRRVSTICKAVTALANSAGGQFIVGVQSRDGIPYGLDSGVSGPSQRDWIFQIVSNQTHPPLEALEVYEVPSAGGFYYVVDVSASRRAPHQFEGRYYKRRGPHSDPMEHYEIEDVRNRPKTEVSPLRIEIGTSEEVFFLITLRNEHNTEPLTNLRFELTPTFKLDTQGAKILSERGLRSLRPATTASFFLGGVIEILKESPNAELGVKARYDLLGRQLVETFHFHIGDLSNTAIVRSPEVAALKQVVEKMDKVVAELERMRRNNEQLLSMVDHSGLRLSHRTLTSIGKPVKYRPKEFDAAGYQLVLGISRTDAWKLDEVFHRWGTDARSAYAALPSELRSKFETAFTIEFD